ncbi:MAG TPA: alpha/beta fold hydrolase [Anaerolineales bacterium]|nr:alpha/beta fold hydrolase [Anaerolineales bacterium]
MSTSSNSKDWFICPQANPEAELRIFLFPYAGGSPSVFNKWAAGFPGNVETRIAHYPGRGSRHNEALIKQISVLAEGLAEAVQPLADKPFAFLGHSLGGLVAFELARGLRRSHQRQPDILFISACGAPHLPDPHPPIHELPDPEFLHSLQQLHGVPAEALQQPEVMQLLLPILRADFQAMESYVYTPEPPLPCPIRALGGCDDPRLSRKRLEDWCLQTSSSCKAEYFAGDHFFIHTAREAVIASITAELAAAHE